MTNMTTLSPIGVLLVNLGTPKSPNPGDVFTYLNEFLTDGRVIDFPWLPRQLLVRGIIVPFRYKNSARTYQQIWDKDKGSPLMYHSLALLDKVKKRMPEGYVVELAMRYQQPSIESALEKLREQKVKEIIIFPLYPHYASSSTGTVHQKVLEVLAKWQNIPSIKLINSYPDHPDFIHAIVEKVKKYDLSSFDHVLFSYHGIPVRHIRKADETGGKYCYQDAERSCCNTLTEINQFCYRAQSMATTRALVKALALKEGDYSTAFQSRLGKEEWIQPYTSDEIERLAKAGKKKVLVISPAFTADCLETIFEVSVEYQEEFEEMGGEKLQLVESLNDSDLWADAVVGMVAGK
jgi:protoporphyrin/coproporphyrin ferrochelatase